MPRERITFTLHHLVAELDGLADAILRKEFGITHSQFAFLLAVEDTQPVDVTTLAKRLAVSKAAVSKRVTWFVHRHYVTVSHENQRGRRVVLALTPGGADLARRASDVLDRRFAELTTAFEGVDLPALHDGLHSVLEQVRAARRERDLTERS
jgi:DNA-binding MarR family transcriptional regulator